MALVYNGISHAVMMATPCDIEDFARGFTLTEHIVEKPSEIFDIEAEPVGRGIEVQLRIAGQRMAALQERRRTLAGRTGCGLCGVDSLEAALRPVPATRSTAIGVARGHRARDGGAAARAAHQPRQRRHPCRRLGDARRHACWRCARMSAGTTRSTSWPARWPGSDLAGEGGFVVVTSRCSYEMVQKAAAIDAAAIAAVSAPTSLAIETAEQAGLALVAFVRDDRLTVYAHGERIEA